MARHTVAKNAYRLRERGEPNNRIKYLKRDEIIYARTAEDQKRWHAADKEMIVAALDRTEEHDRAPRQHGHDRPRGAARRGTAGRKREEAKARLEEIRRETMRTRNRRMKSARARRSRCRRSSAEHGGAGIDAACVHSRAHCLRLCTAVKCLLCLDLSSGVHNAH